MAHKVNWPTWVNLLREDAEWVEAQDRTLERDHVSALLRQLMDENEPGSRAFYDAQPHPEPRE